MKNKYICLLAALSLIGCGEQVSVTSSLSSSISSEESSQIESEESSLLSSEEESTSEYSIDSIGDEYNGYYTNLNNSFGPGQDGAFRKALTKLIRPRNYYTYSGSGEGTLGLLLQSADEDPENPNNMILFYTQESIKKQSSGTWNREHVWPQSLSGGLYGTNEGGTDLLHIRPTYTSTNSTRSNYKFGIASKNSPCKFNGKTYAYLSGGFFEPSDDIKGDVARIVLYMWVTYFAERNTPITNVAQSLELMVEWANEDAPSQQEKNRNDFVQKSFQKNRNPFVDHPEWVNYIFA